MKKAFRLASESKAAVTRVKHFRIFKNVCGATFRRDGKLFYGLHGDIIPIASVVMETRKLCPSLIENFANKHPKAKIGIYRFKNHRFVSIDANIIRSVKNRKANLELARKSKQESIFNLTNKQVIDT